MTRTRAFFSILCIVLAGTVGLVLSLIHPGWAVRLTRYVSHHMVGRVGGRSRSSRRRSGGRARQVAARTSLRPASKPEPVTMDHPVSVDHDVASTLVNLGMKRQAARKLAMEAVQGRDFDSALRWAVGRAA